MKTARRAIRTLIRSPLRSLLLIAVLAVSIGLALIMITVNQAFAKRLDDIKSQAGTSITVRPAGSFGGGFFDGGGGGNGNFGGNQNGDAQTTAPPTLTDDQISEVASLPNVVSVTKVLTARYTGSELVAAAIQGPDGGGAGGGPGGGGAFTPPIQVTGTTDPNTLTTVATADVTMVSGATFTDADADANVAVVGQNLAEANNLQAGSMFQLNGTTFTVSGVYSTGTQFGDNALFIPLATAQRVFDRAGEIDQATLYADNVDHVQAVSDNIRSALGSDTVDVTTEQSTFNNIASPLSDAKSSSQIGMFTALAASAAVILFSISLVARQRIREIGILKAIGASGLHVTGQFAVETVVLSVSAAVIGALATFPLAQTVANSLVSDPSTPQFGGGPGGGGPGGGGGAGFRAAQAGGGFLGANNLLGDVSVAVSADVFFYALAIAIGLALIAAIVPAWFVGRVRPAEVLRHE